MRAIAERIRLVCAFVGQDEGTEAISYRELSKRSGLEPTTIGALMARVEKDPNTTAEIRLLQAIAIGANCRAAWLLTGEGDWRPGPSKLYAAVQAAKACDATDEDVSVFFQSIGSPAKLDAFNAIEIARMIVDLRARRLGKPVRTSTHPKILKGL